MLLITGASGQIGGRVAQILARQGHALRLMVRDLGRSPQVAAGEVVQGDYAQPATLDRAFAGVKRALLVSGYARPGDRAQLHKNAIDAAVRAGVHQLVYLSFQGASPTSPFPMAQDHYQTEQFLQASGLAFTALRDSLYLDVIPQLFDGAGVLRGPAGNGAVAWVTREDVARVAAAVLMGPAEGQAIYDVTGPEAITLAETARRLSVLSGRPYGYEPESVEAGRHWRSQLGAPAWEVDTWLGSYLAIAAGELSPTSDTVRRFTGRQPLSLEAFFAQSPHWLRP